MMVSLYNKTVTLKQYKVFDQVLSLEKEVTVNLLIQLLEMEPMMGKESMFGPVEGNTRDSSRMDNQRVKE